MSKYSTVSFERNAIDGQRHCPTMKGLGQSKRMLCLGIEKEHQGTLADPGPLEN